MARALTLAALTETALSALALTTLSTLTGLSALALTTPSALAALTSLALRTLSALTGLTGLASGCFARDAFLRLDHFLDRAVFVEEELVDADGAAEALASLTVAVQCAVMVEEIGVPLEIDHAGVDREAVASGAGNLSAERPGTTRFFGCGVVDGFAAATA